MFDFHEKRKIRRVVYSKFFIVGIFLVTFLIGRSVFERYTMEREMAEKLENRIEERELLHARAAALESKVKHLRNERGIEEELRTRFDVAREGEQVVIIIDDPEKKEQKSFVSDEEIAESSNTSFFEMLKFW
jgi:cell division protein FtsB